MLKRSLQLPSPGTETFFLWGPRQTGKTTLLQSTYPDAVYIDLLKAEEYRRYLNNPEYLRQELLSRDETPFVVIDEVQKLPILLDEVHWLHENRNIHFALCGSSARKVKRGHANLLGGRAIRYELFGLVSSELSSDFDLNRFLNTGYLPRIFFSGQPRRLLNAYVANYLKEEIAAEGLVRNLPVFSNFLNLASLSDSETVNFSTIARDCGVSSQTVKEYFQILEDTLLGRWLPSFRKRPKRRVAQSPKFYFSDVGIVNILAKRGTVQPGSELYGKAFENWCFHELNAYNIYSEAYAELSFWKLASGIEVDFVVNDMEIALEVKSSEKISDNHLKGLRSLRVDHPAVKRRIVVCNDQKMRVTEDNIEIVPAQLFATMLWEGELF
jgi:predicted AAA+ superfamily ATPase